LSKIFKVIKKRHTVTDIDPSWHPVKMKLTIAFQSDEMTSLNRGSKKTGLLIDFYPSYLKVQQKLIQERTFCLACMRMECLAKKETRYPLLLKILRTCHDSIPQELYKKVIINCTCLYNVMIEHGYIPEEVFNELCFPMGGDVDGREVFQNAGIAQEIYQKAKCLTRSTNRSMQKV